MLNLDYWVYSGWTGVMWVGRGSIYYVLRGEEERTGGTHTHTHTRSTYPLCHRCRRRLAVSVLFTPQAVRSWIMDLRSAIVKVTSFVVSTNNIDRTSVRDGWNDESTQQCDFPDWNKHDNRMNLWPSHHAIVVQGRFNAAITYILHWTPGQIVWTAQHVLPFRI